jgi:hypothetical protein
MFGLFFKLTFQDQWPPNKDILNVLEGHDDGNYVGVPKSVEIF